MSRPAETLQAIVSGAIGAAFIIYGAMQDGIEFDDLANPEVVGAITVLTGLVAAARTWWVARRQRDPADDLGSASDGTVTG